MSQEQGYKENSREPKLKLPAGSCDTHCHIFGPADRFPYAPGSSFIPPKDASKEVLYALHRKLGIERCVIVQSACHGFDNSATADGIAAGGGNYLGIALTPVDMPVSELRKLYDQGFRGVRFNFMRHLTASASIENVVSMTSRLADAGMHLQVHMEADLIESVTAELRKSAVPVVIDHIGRVDASLGLDQAPFAALRRYLGEGGERYVKVSGCDRSTRTGPPYDDAVPFAAALVREFPSQVLWGTDFPHPNHRGPIPDDGDLVDLISRMAPEPELMQALMVDNPARLYGF
jgi:2-pyrone-4,6-dicarboxylate lactonase